MDTMKKLSGQMIDPSKALREEGIRRMHQGGGQLGGSCKKLVDLTKRLGEEKKFLRNIVKQRLSPQLQLFQKDKVDKNDPLFMYASAVNETLRGNDDLGQALIDETREILRVKFESGIIDENYFLCSQDYSSDGSHNIWDATVEQLMQ